MHNFTSSSVICLVIFVVGVIATIYENKLTNKGFNINEDDKDEIYKHTLSKSKSSEIATDRCEMNNMSQNNKMKGNECEIIKKPEKCGLQRLG